MAFSSLLRYGLAALFLLRLAGGLKFHQAARQVVDPSAVDANFLPSIQAASGDVLALLYSPTCPDCEWLMEKVWKNVADRLASVPDITVMTISDPGFAAPKPFEHWHNPAIFYVNKDHKDDPIFFPQARLQEYLAGLPSRPQDQQDADFMQDLLVFAKGALGFRLATGQVLASQGPARDVEHLADNGWRILQGKWAAQRNAARSANPAQAQAPQPVTSLMVSGQAMQPYGVNALPTMQAPQPVTSLMMSGQAMQPYGVNALPTMQAPMPAAQAPQGPSQLAMAYAEQFMRDHTGEGYTTAGVYNYVLPYYQNYPQTR